MCIRDRPKRLAIIGGGVIGCEIGAAFAYYGSKVTMIEAEERLLPFMDKDISAALEETFGKLGIEIHTSTKVESISAEKGCRVICLSLIHIWLVHGTTHLGVGEEATAVGSILALKAQDYVFGTHRGHNQAITKGVNINHMMAEILARATGVCKGKGGSMHIADPDIHYFGADGVLGTSRCV